MKKEIKSIVLSNQLFSENIYQNHKLYKEKLSVINKEIQSRMGEERRFYNEEIGVVAKYVGNASYETDNKGFNTYLHDLGILIPIAKVDSNDPEILEKIEKFKNEPTYQLRFYAGKTTKFEGNFNELNIEQLLNEWLTTHKEFKKLEEQLNNIKEEILKCPDLIANKTLEFDFGKVQVLQNKPTYDTMSIYNEFGADFLIENSKPLLKNLDYYVQQGFITKKEIYQFKTLVSQSSKFVVMTLESESRSFQFLNDIAVKGSLNTEALRRKEREIV